MSGKWNLDELLILTDRLIKRDKRCARKNIDDEVDK